MFWRRKGNEDEDPFAALRQQSPGETTRVTTARPSEDALGGDRRDATAAFGEERHGRSDGNRDGHHGVRDAAGRPGANGSAHHGARDAACRRRPDKPRRGADRLLVLLTVVLALGGAGVLVWFGEQDAEERGVGEANALLEDVFGGGDDAAADGGDREEAAPAERANLVRPGGLRRALAQLREAARPGETVTSLRVAPERITAIVIGRDEQQRLLNVTDDLEVDATEAGTGGSRRGYRFAQIDAAAPWRAVRGAARQGRFPARRLDYLVLTAPFISGQQATWSIFFTDVPARDRHWIAARDGAPVHRPGEQPGSVTRTSTSTTTTGSRISITRNGRTIELNGKSAERIARCVQRAGTDAAKIQRCLP